MRRLSETSESRRAQVRQTAKQLKKAQLALKELRKAIQLKVWSYHLKVDSKK